jgi:hypothetical protein
LLPLSRKTSLLVSAALTTVADAPFEEITAEGLIDHDIFDISSKLNEYSVAWLCSFDRFRDRPILCSRSYLISAAFAPRIAVDMRAAKAKHAATNCMTCSRSQLQEKKFGDFGVD